MSNGRIVADLDRFTARCVDEVYRGWLVAVLLRPRRGDRPGLLIFSDGSAA